MAETYIDIEPTWETLCKMSQDGHLEPKELMQACVIADMIRQVQKNGKQYIKFLFEADEITVLTNEDEVK